MYNYNSDISRCEPDYEVETNDESYEGPTWSSILNIWKKATNGTHNLLPQYNTISASTTATNLSDYQSNSTLYKNPRMATLSENLRINQPELEPLSGKKDEDGALQLNIDNDSESGESSWSELTTGEKFSRMYPQLIAAIAVSWISLTIGYASAYTSPAIPSMEKDLHVSPNEVSWICGLMPLGALGGGLLGGPLIEYLGRKKTLLVTDLLFLAAWAVNFFASDYAYMYVSRIIVGCSVGIASLTLPVYLGETIQPEVRGSLGLLPTAFGNIGILICFLMGTFLEWRYLAGIGGLLPVPFLLLFIWIIPETPRWYISKGKEEDSRKALQWLRSKNQNIDKEFMDLVRTQKEADNKNESMLDLFSRGNLKPLMICLGLMFFQQLSGINAVIFYTTNIFRESGSTLDPNICTLIVGIVNFISTFIATVLIDRLGRKILLYISSVSMIVTLGILGVYFFMLNVTEVDMSSYGIVPLVSFVVYVLGFSLGFGPIPWLMMGEILPARIRGPAASVSTAFNWSCTFIVTKAFLLVIDLLGMHGTFWLFGAIMVIALVFTILFVPETKGQTLEDIERKLAGIKVRRRSSIANFKSTPSSC